LSSKLAELIAELDRQKRAYHEKTLSVDGEWSIFMRSFQIYDFTLDLSRLLIPEFYFASASLSTLFRIDLFDLEPLNLEFTWRFPTLDEWLRGVSIVFERVTPAYATDYKTYVETNIAPEYREPLLIGIPEKCVWGKSRYGMCYVDPVAVREFLRATITRMLLKHRETATRRASITSLAKTLNVNLDLARSTHDRMSLVIAEQTGCFTLGYSLLGMARLCEPRPEAPELGVVVFEDLEGVVKEATVSKLADSQFGCILGVAVLGYCYLMPKVDIYQHSPEPLFKGVSEKLDMFRGRFMLTAPGLSNYVRGDEAADYHKAERTNVWGELMASRYEIEAVAGALLDHIAPELNVFDRRKYITAVLQLVGHVGKRHRWGYAAYKAMTDEELKAWWLEHWAGMGLDRAVLERLYESVKVWLRPVVEKKVEMGRRLRQRRLGLPLD